MRGTKTISGKLDALRAALDAGLGVRGRSFEVALGRAGRRLPRRVRAQAQLLVEAERMGGNPKLERRIEGVRLDRAYREVLAHLESIDRADLRRGRLLGIAGVVVFNLIVVAIVFVTYLWWRGFL